MAKSIRLAKSFLRLLLPVTLLLIAVGAGAGVWLVYETSQPGHKGYLVTPDKYGLLSARGAQVTEETWQGRDGAGQKGWLLRGMQDAPAVVLLHKYGADRSHVLNLGVKLNEATNFTVLMPDQRGHGSEPGAKHTTFAGCETDDTLAAIDFLKSLKTPEQFPLIGKEIGLYGLEMGALSALTAAGGSEIVKALALDSVPADSDALLASAIGKRFPFGSDVTAKLGQMGTYGYYYDGCYKRVPACDMAKMLQNKKVMLLAGADAADFQESTSKLSKCFPASSKMDSKTDLSPSGMGIINASLELSEAYDQRVIDFFRMSLGPQEPMVQIAAN